MRGKKGGNGGGWSWGDILEEWGRRRGGEERVLGALTFLARCYVCRHKSTGRASLCSALSRDGEK